MKYRKCYYREKLIEVYVDDYGKFTATCKELHLTGTEFDRFDSSLTDMQFKIDDILDAPITNMSK